MQSSLVDLPQSLVEEFDITELQKVRLMQVIRTKGTVEIEGLECESDYGYYNVVVPGKGKVRDFVVYGLCGTHLDAIIELRTMMFKHAA